MPADSQRDSILTSWQFKPNARRPETSLTWFQSWLLSRGGSRFKFVQEKPQLYPGRVVRNTVAVAARRSGKTVGSRLLALTACLDDGPGDVGYMAPTLGQAKRLLWRPLMQDLKNPATKAFVEGRPNNSELTVEFKTGTRLYLYSAEAFERVRGDGFKLFITDETDDPLFTDDVFDEAIYPALSDNLGSLVQLGTPKGRGRLYREFKKGQPGPDYDPLYDSIQVTAMEAGIIDRSEIEFAKRTRPPRAFAQEYLATFNSPVGIVYEEWNTAVHVVPLSKIPRRFDYTIACVDWGTAARGSMLILGIDRVYRTHEGERPRIWVVEEQSNSGVPYTDAGWWQIARDLQRDWQPVAWYCDPAGGMDKLLEELKKALRRDGASTQVVAADNKVRPGIAAVQEFLHYDQVLKEEPHLFVSDKCPQIIAEFANYRYRAHRNIEGEYVDEVVKENDHCFVVGTMVTTIDGDVPIERIKTGDMVMTRDGYMPVKAAGMTNADALIWSLTTETGKRIEATPNHKILSASRGWVALALITNGDHVFTRQGIERVNVVRAESRREAVYDLTVDGPPEFFANGILVHNCLDALRYGVFSRFFSRKHSGVSSAGGGFS